MDHTISCPRKFPRSPPSEDVAARDQAAKGWPDPDYLGTIVTHMSDTSYTMLHTCLIWDDKNRGFNKDLMSVSLAF